MVSGSMQGPEGVEFCDVRDYLGLPDSDSGLIGLHTLILRKLRATTHGHWKTMDQVTLSKSKTLILNMFDGYKIEPCFKLVFA